MTLRQGVLCCCIGLALILIPPVYAKESTSPASFQALKAFLANTQSLKAKFEQVSIDESNRPVQVSNGIFLLSRPGKFRWEYQKPFQQQIVSNGEKVWFYDVDLEQVTVKNKASSMGSAPALLLSGSVDLEKSFTLEQLRDEEGLQRFKLVPKSENSGFQYVLLGLEKQTLKSMELNDHFGGLIRIRFSDIETGIQLDDANFIFTPPAGVDVFAG